MKKRAYPCQVRDESNKIETAEGDTLINGDELMKGTICKVCERKFQMHIYWNTQVP